MNPEVWQRISSATTSCCSTVLIFPPTGAGAPAFQSMSVLEGDTTVWGYCPPGRG
ncbi:thioesterase, partial [Cutibacterium acnes]